MSFMDRNKYKKKKQCPLKNIQLIQFAAQFNE